MKKAIIIFSGFNQRAVVAFLRTLHPSAIDYAVIACTENDSILSTVYKKNVLSIRKERALVLEDILQCINTVKSTLQADTYTIAPSTEALNRFLLQHRAVFEEYGCDVPLVDETLYKVVSDKYKFSEKCLEHAISVPQEYNELSSVRLPFVAKPREYYARDGAVHSPVLIFDKEDQWQFAEKYNAEEFYFQEFVNGESIYLLYYFYKDGSVAKLSQQNFVQQPAGRSIIAARSSDFHETNESTKYEKLFKSLGFFGLVMVEVKRSSDGAFYMIEANPRFWGPSQLFVDTGLNLFMAFLYDVGLIKGKPSFESVGKKAAYFWFGGMIDALVDGGKIAYHNYTADQYLKDLPEWLPDDVYNKDDTREIFKQEMRL